MEEQERPGSLEQRGRVGLWDSQGHQELSEQLDQVDYQVECASGLATTWKGQEGGDVDGTRRRLKELQRRTQSVTCRQIKRDTEEGERNRQIQKDRTERVIGTGSGRDLT